MSKKEVLIAIPSYGRAKTTKVFKLLLRNYLEIEDTADIRGFVTRPQKNLYFMYNPDIEFVERLKNCESDIGLCRAFIIDWAEKQGYEHVLMIDDDVAWIRTVLRGENPEDSSHIRRLQENTGVVEIKELVETLFWCPEKRSCYYRSDPIKTNRTLVDRESLLNLLTLSQEHTIVGALSMLNGVSRYKNYLCRGVASQVMMLNIKRLRSLGLNFTALSKCGIEDFYLSYQLLLKGEAPISADMVMYFAPNQGEGKGGLTIDFPNLEVRMREAVEKFTSIAIERPEWYSIVTNKTGLPYLKFNWKSIPEEIS